MAEKIRFWATGIEPMNGFIMTPLPPVTRARDAARKASRLAEDERRAEIAAMRIKMDAEMVTEWLKK